MRKLLSDHFISCSTLPSEFEENFLPILSHSLKDTMESTTEMVNLGPKLMDATISSDLLTVDWKMLEGEVRLPRFHKVRSLDFDELSALLSVYKLLYRESITSISSLGKTVRTIWQYHYRRREVWLEA